MNDGGAPGAIMGASLVASLDSLGEHDFSIVWAHNLSDEQRASISPEDCERFRERWSKANPHVAPRLSIVERAQARLNELRGAWPEPLDLKALAERDPRPPAFIIPDWLPVGYATLLAGHGGVGKSAIALLLAVCIALGLAFFGLKCERRKVMYLSCEDRENAVHWRLSRVANYLGISIADLHGWLEIIDLVGQDSVLWERDPRTGGTFTSAFGWLQERVEQHSTEVLFIDGTSDTFAGNESARSDVKRFVNAGVSLIPADRGALVLIGHIAKPTASAVQTTEGYSGSTAWHNSVRARWYLFPETIQTDEGDRPERSGDLILELQKSNLGRIDQSMRFSWDAAAHLFVGREIVGATALDRAHRDRIEHRDILKAFAACARKGIEVPAAMSGPRTGYAVLSATPEFPDTLKRGGRASVRRFRRCIESLRQSGALIEQPYMKGNRHRSFQLTLSPEGLRQCAS